MFTIRIQSVKVTKLGKTYENVKSSTVEAFNEQLAEVARQYAKNNNYVIQMYLDKQDAIPAGYASKELEYSRVIWKTNISSLEDALALFQS